MQELTQFMKDYEAATNSHQFGRVAPLIAVNAVYWFSDGSFSGIEEIRQAFESTWQKIKNETYSINDMLWVVVEENTAVCIYRFEWSGMVGGQVRSGSGRGTNVLIKQNDEWKMLHEHLSS
jgi:ketosteroid isomerase-like protein